MPDSTALSTSLIHHPYQPPGGFGVGAAGGAQGVDGDLRERRRAARARLEAQDRLHLRPARHADELHARGAHRDARGRPADADRAERPRRDHAGRHVVAVGGRRSAAAGQRLRSRQGAGAQRTGALGHRPSLLRSGRPVGAGRDDRSGDEAGLARGGRLGDDGIPGPAGARGGRAREGRDRRARQHLGCRGRVRSVRSPPRAAAGARCRHLGAGADQVRVGRRRPADGIGDDSRQRTCTCASSSRTCAWAGASAPTTSRRCCVRCRRSRSAMPPRTARRAHWRRWWQGRPEVAQVLHPAMAESPGHAHWTALCTQAAGLFSIVFDARFRPAQVDAFIDCAPPLQDRLLVGRPGQPRRPVRSGGDASERVGAAARWCASRSVSKASTT